MLQEFIRSDQKFSNRILLVHTMTITGISTLQSEVVSKAFFNDDRQYLHSFVLLRKTFIF